MNLKELLGEELHQQVQAKLEKAEGDVKLLVNDGSFIPRDRLNDKNEKIELLEGQLKEVKEQLTERDKQLEQLKNDTQASDELKKRIEELESQNKKATEEYETKIQQKEEEYQTKIEQQKFDNALELALRDADAKNVKAVKALLNTEEIKLDGDKLLGLDGQLEKVKKEADYLFGQETIKGTKPNQSGQTVPANPDLENMSDEEYFKYREKNEL